MIPCHATNYQSGRAGTIQYLVIHYTAGNGDTAKDNCQYFKNNPGLYASAHYFVDETGWEQSVADADTAWHCGANTYQHPKCLQQQLHWNRAVQQKGYRRELLLSHQNHRQCG